MILRYVDEYRGYEIWSNDEYYFLKVKSNESKSMYQIKNIKNLYDLKAEIDEMLKNINTE